MITSSSFQELLYPGLTLIYGTAYKEYPLQFEKVFDMEKSTRSFEVYQELYGLGLVPQKPEGTETVYEDPGQGYQTVLTNQTFSLGFKVTQEMWEDDQYNQINKFPQLLAKSVAETVNIQAANVLNNAFSSSYLGVDGVPLVSAVHPLPAGGTASNTLAAAADLSMQAINQALVDISNFVDGRNQKIMADGVTLIVPKALEKQAQELMASTLDPESANNTVNSYKGRLKVECLQFLTDPDAWFIRVNVPGLVFQKRIWPADLRNDNEFNADVAKFKTRYRTAAGWYDWRSVFGVPGA